jgi:hypothetical protein
MEDYMERTQLATVKYQVATYKGQVQVNCLPDDDNEIIIAKAKRVLKRQVGPLPFGYQSFKVVDRKTIY